MKRSFTFFCGVVLLSSVLCATQELIHNNTNLSDIEEALKLKTILDATRPSTTLKPFTTSSTTTSQPTTGSKEDKDYSFQNDRLPILTDDEFNNLTDDANPLHFLKQLPEESKPQTESLPLNNQDSKPDPVAGSPIFITIPIYINTAGKIPLTLSIGGQELSLSPEQSLNSGHKRKVSTKNPNSHFNRLLEIEPIKRRMTNRHRSTSRNKIKALKELEEKKENQ